VASASRCACALAHADGVVSSVTRVVLCSRDDGFCEVDVIGVVVGVVDLVCDMCNAGVGADVILAWSVKSSQVDIMSVTGLRDRSGGR